MPIDEGLVYKSTGSRYIVKTRNGKFLECHIKGRLRIEGFTSTNPIAVGDHVLVDINPKEEIGIITQLQDRKNYIIRKSPNLSKQTHIIAANIDQAIIMATLVLPETPIEFIDRFLAVAEAYSIPATIVLNKCDLYTSEFSELINFWKEIYNSTKYNMIEISVKTGFQLNILQELLSKKVSLISGNSGVGKSALIQSMVPQANIRIGQLSEYHLSGKHTTTFAEMYELPEGGHIIDTPGIKGFGLYGIDRTEIYHFFPEIFMKAKNCQFHNCLHINEPNCSVLEAVRKNEIHWSRYKSYISILEDDQSKYR